VSSLFSLADGEFMVGFIVPDPARMQVAVEQVTPAEDQGLPEPEEEKDQLSFRFDSEEPQPSLAQTPSEFVPTQGILVTRLGKGFRFDYDLLKEPTKRGGRKLVNLGSEDDVVSVIPVQRETVAVGADSGHVLAFAVDQVPVLAGPAGGVRMMKLQEEAVVVGLDVLSRDDSLRIQPVTGKEKILGPSDLPTANRATKGKRVCRGILMMERTRQAAEQDQ
jgi:DNA gyrase/topoisomerase IV subunit A